VIVATLALGWGRAAFGVERSGAPRAASPAIMPTTWPPSPASPGRS